MDIDTSVILSMITANGFKTSLTLSRECRHNSWFGSTGLVRPSNVERYIKQYTNTNQMGQYYCELLNWYHSHMPIFVWPSCGPHNALTHQHSDQWPQRMTALWWPILVVRDSLCMGQHYINQTTTEPVVVCHPKNIGIIARPGPHTVDKPLARPAVSQECQVDTRSEPHLSAVWIVIYFVWNNSKVVKHTLQLCIIKIWG